MPANTQGGAPLTGRSMRLVSRERHVLVTPLDAEECRARLAANTAAWATFLPRLRRPTQPLQGTVWAHSFAVTLTTSYPQPFPTLALGHFTSQPGGTRIDVDVGIPLWQDLMVTLLVGLLLAFMGLVSGSDPLAGMALFLAGACGYGLLVIVGRRLARREPVLLLNVIRALLEAEEKRT